MLRANKAAFEHHVKLQALQIREEEMSFFSRSLSTLAACSSLMAGLAYAGLGQMRFIATLEHVDPNKSAKIIGRSMFYSLVVLSMVANMATMIIATLGQIDGPSLALRGPEGSINRAIFGLRQTKTVCVWCLRIGLYCILLSCYPYFWTSFVWEVALVASIATTVCFGYLIKEQNNMHALFSLSNDLKQTGDVHFKISEDEFDGLMEQPSTDSPNLSETTPSLDHKKPARRFVGFSRQNHSAPVVASGVVIKGAHIG